MNVNIWGCRGSIARSHPSLIRYGGNTPCVEVVFEWQGANGEEEGDTGKNGKQKGDSSGKGETRIVLDMGSGSYDLGQKLVKLGPLKDHHIFLTHCHWDHIQGFPFFAPFFIPSSHWHIHAPGGFTTSLKEKLASQMSYEFFPLEIDMLGATIEYHELAEGTLTLMGDQDGEQQKSDNTAGKVLVTCQYLNHPVLTLGYRLESMDHGACMAYITDHEPFNQAFATDGYTGNHSAINPNDGSTTTSANGDDRHVEFLKDVDLLIHDAQYTAEEYKGKTGWGHGTVEYVVDIAMAAQIKTLVLFHHDPQRTDEQVDGLVQLAQDRVRNADNNSPLQVRAAADRASIYVPPKENRQHVRDSMAAMDLSDSAITHTMKEGDHKRHIVVSCQCNEDLFADCAKDGIEMTFLPQDDNGSIVSSSRREEDLLHPADQYSLLVLSCKTKHQGCQHGVELCRRIRQKGAHDIPILLVAQDREELLRYQEEADGAGVTDWLVEPFTPAYIRTRIRMGVARSPCRWVPSLMPTCELERRASLEALQLAKDHESRFDAIVELARISLGVTGAFLNFIETDHQWTKAFSCPMLGSDNLPGLLPRDVSMCSHTILQNELLIINDTLADHRFADSPAARDGLKVRFYAGCPISIPYQNGEYNIGSLCITDSKPRKFDAREQDMLRRFAGLLRRELLTSAAAEKELKIRTLLPLNARQKYSEINDN